MSYLVKDELGREVNVFAEDKTIWFDAEKNCTARHNEMNEKAGLKYLQDSQEELDSKVIDPKDLNDIIDAIIENPVIKLEVGSNEELKTKLEILYVPEKNCEISEECTKYTIVIEDEKVISYDEKTDILTPITDGITYIILKWLSGVQKRVRVEVGSVAEVKDYNDPSNFSDPNRIEVKKDDNTSSTEGGIPSENQ